MHRNGAPPSLEGSSRLVAAPGTFSNAATALLTRSPDPKLSLRLFGALGVAFGVINAVFNAREIPQFLRFAAEIDEPSEAVQLRLMLVHDAVMIAMDVALILVAILLLRRSELGRKLAIVWAGVAIGVLFARGWSIEWLMPLYDARFEAVAASDLHTALFLALNRSGIYVPLALLTLFPLHLLFAMIRSGRTARSSSLSS
jgi:hypothetical protein